MDEQERKQNGWASRNLPEPKFWVLILYGQTGQNFNSSGGGKLWWW